MSGAGHLDPCLPVFEEFPQVVRRNSSLVGGWVNRALNQIVIQPQRVSDSACLRSGEGDFFKTLGEKQDVSTQRLPVQGWQVEFHRWREIKFRHPFQGRIWPREELMTTQSRTDDAASKPFLSVERPAAGGLKKKKNLGNEGLYRECPHKWCCVTES